MATSERSFLRCSRRPKVSEKGSKPSSLRDLSFRLASEPSANFSKKTPLASRPPTRFASQVPGVRLVSSACRRAYAFRLSLLLSVSPPKAGSPLRSEPPRSAAGSRSRFHAVRPFSVLENDVTTTKFLRFVGASQSGGRPSVTPRHEFIPLFLL